MKPAYSNLILQTGAIKTGIISVKVVPREWLIADPAIDFLTGKVITPVSLQEEKEWITLEFTPPTYKYEEKPKANKSGTFYDISLAGTLNNYNAEVQQIVESLKYHELVAIVMDVNKRIKIVGTKDFGFVFSSSNNFYSSSIELIMETEFPAPFYEVQ